MIREFERYHGIVLTRMVRGCPQGVCVAPYQRGRSSYVVEDSIGLYIKYSTSRLTPWRFSFTRIHQQEILDLHSTFGVVFVALVCGMDGVAVVDYAQLREILDEVFEPTEWVRVDRRQGHRYRVSGSDGRLRFRIADGSFPERVLNQL